MSGTLFICATPIGNLEDITLRALRILKEVDLIACEDTRWTQKLLNHYQIKTLTTSYFKFNESAKLNYLVSQLKEEKNIALVSSAGTPIISDPGHKLVQQCLKEKIKVVPIPGPSALITALSVCGFSGNSFQFLGFLPRKRNERKKILFESMQNNNTLIFYEAPHRMKETLADLEEVFVEGNVFIGREMTKKFEELIFGTLNEVKEKICSKECKGEFTVIFEMKQGTKKILTKPKQILKELLKLKISRKDSAKLIETLTGISHREAYKLTFSTLE